VRAEVERQASLAARLPAVLAGAIRPGDALETLDFARICYDKGLHAASARLWAEALLADPKLADDLQVGHRYDAACAAALAGCGRGRDRPTLDEASRTRWRRQALQWLEADLAACSRMLECGPPRARQSVPGRLRHWKTDPDLAGLRDREGLAEMPEHERKACRALWARVDAMLTQATGRTSR
jgi:serine/threonine-protein kinase